MPDLKLNLADHHPEFLDRVFLGNPLWQWIVAVGIAFAIGFLSIVLRGFLVSRLKKWSQRTTTPYDDLAVSLLSDLRSIVLIILGVWAGSSALVLPAEVAKGIRLVAIIAIALQLLLTSRKAIDFSLQVAVRRWSTRDGTPDPTVQSGIGIVRFMVMLIVAILIILLALDNLGVQVTPMIAGLGIGGIAIALAVQNILGDLFASLSILFDKPFMIGDSIVVDNLSGTVERIGVKTTHLRAPTGEQLIFSNSDLLKSRIKNYRRMPQRRVVFTLSVPFETPPAKLRAIPGMVKDIIEPLEKSNFERCHLVKLGASSLDYEVSYQVDSGDYTLHMDTLQAINLGLIERFAREGIEFAYPTQMTVMRAGEAAEGGPEGERAAATDATQGGPGRAPSTQG